LTAAKLEPFEVIVVDDGSSDGTGETAAAAGARVETHPHNVGYGHSLKTGIQAATYETIVITDADGTYPIESIPALVTRFRDGFDMVVGARSGRHYKESLLKMPLRWILRQLVEFTAGRHIPDINSGLRVFKRSTAIGYFSHLCDTFSFTTSMTLAYVMTGRFVGYETIDYLPRVGRTKVKLLKDSFKTLQYILEASIYYNPLRIFFAMALAILLSSAGSLLLALLTGLTVFYFVGVGGVIVAGLVMAIGLLAVLLRQIMIQSSPPDSVIRGPGYGP
jgi:polyisoprenyl-phosphate glycosyltransferase